MFGLGSATKTLIQKAGNKFANVSTPKPKVKVSQPKVYATNSYAKPAPRVASSPIQPKPKPSPKRQVSRARSTRENTSRDVAKQVASNIGRYLKPTRPFTEVMPYETYAKPQMEAFNLWRENVFRPEFERNIYNPYMQRQAINAAVSGSGLLGGAKEAFARSRNQLMQEQLYDPLERAKSAQEDMIRQGWQQQMREYYTNPGAFTNI